MAGTMSLVETRGDIDFAYIFNTSPADEVVDAFYKEMNTHFDQTPLPEPDFHLAPTPA
jgi:hypothetical protein